MPQTGSSAKRRKASLVKFLSGNAIQPIEVLTGPVDSRKQPAFQLDMELQFF
jgi:hypothetical protein